MCLLLNIRRAWCLNGNRVSVVELNARESLTKTGKKPGRFVENLRMLAAVNHNALQKFAIDV